MKTQEMAQKLQVLQQAVGAHIGEMDLIMKGPASHERGRKIAQSVCTLQAALIASQAKAKRKA